jgi:uncharacterized protein YndB with AHSA1/START domain
MTERDASTEEQRLTFDFALPAPPEKVWRALTIPAFIDRWLMPLEKSRGDGFSGRPRHGAGIAAQVIEAEPPRRLSWHWREAGEPDGLVTFTLTPDEAGGTLLRLVHVRQVRAATMPPAANGNSAITMLAA